MDMPAVLNSQYLAALEMLKQAVEGCPDGMWDADEDENKFWRVAYHTLFYTHLYLQKSLLQFRVWEKHWEGAEKMGKEAPSGNTYTRSDVLEYLDFCRQQVQTNTAGLDPEAPSGFHWLPFNKLELQFYNIRHLQQHTGELFERLGTRTGVELHWVSKVP